MVHRCTIVFLAGLLAAAACGYEPNLTAPYWHQKSEVRSTATTLAAVADPERTILRISERRLRGESQRPISLTAPDGTGLVLASLRARAVLEGALAFTELHLVFDNPADKQLEGRFEITLPPGAAVNRFAMRIAGQWQEAEVVELAQARRTYEAFLHQRVDPALLETNAGNTFRARVFPIAPGERKELILSYAEELGAQAPYRLTVGGMPPIGSLSVDVLDGGVRSRRREHDVAPESDLVIPRAPGASAALAQVHGDLVILRAPAAEGSAGQTESLDDLLILVDSSASAAGVFARQSRALNELLAALEERSPEAKIEVAAFDQDVSSLYRGSVTKAARALQRPLVLRAALGASNLEKALRWAASRHERILILSDGIATEGSQDIAMLNRHLKGARLRRVDALSLSSARDHDTLRALVTADGLAPGVVLEGTATVEDWMRRLTQPSTATQAILVDGAEWQWPRSLVGLQTGDAPLIYAVVKGASKRRSVSVTVGGRIHELPLAQGDANLLPLFFARARIQSLLEQLRRLGPESPDARKKLEKQVVDLATSYRITTPFTGFLVLETENDYARFGIPRGDRPDLLGIDATGLRVLRRGRAWSNEALTATGSAVATPEPPPTQAKLVVGGTATTGTLAGTVRDKGSDEPLVGVTVIATSPSLQGTIIRITDEGGAYNLSELPPGVYEVSFYYADSTVERSSIQVKVRRTSILDLQIEPSHGETITISGTPSIDTAATNAGQTLDQDYIREIRVPGRTFENALGAAAGSQHDSMGVSLSGSTSIENQYVVEGVNTTELGKSQDSADSAERRRAMRAAPSPVMRRLAKIMAMLESGERARALADALAWTVEIPGDPFGYLALGEALEASGYPALAARAYSSLIDLYPSRADMRRVAAGYLARLGRAGQATLLDTCAKATLGRPDHLHGFHLQAWALARQGQYRSAIELLLKVLAGDDMPVSIASSSADKSNIERLFELDISLFAAAWMASDTGARDELRKLLESRSILVPMEPSMHVVLSWETDVTDLDLRVAAKADDANAPRGAWTYGNDADGYGPEVVSFFERTDRDHYRIWVDYTNEAMMGMSLGQVQIISHDGAGKVSLETRPFILPRAGDKKDLGPLAVDKLWPRARVP